MSRHVRNRIAKLIRDIEDTSEVVLVFAPWAVAPVPPKTPETPPAPKPAEELPCDDRSSHGSAATPEEPR